MKGNCILMFGEKISWPTLCSDSVFLYRDEGEHPGIDRAFGLHALFGPTDKETPIAKDKLQAQLLEDFDLEVDVDSLFIGAVGNEISHDAFTQVISGSLANPRLIAQRASMAS